jgi:hypothetical protein
MIFSYGLSFEIGVNVVVIVPSFCGAAKKKLALPKKEMLLLNVIVR